MSGALVLAGGGVTGVAWEVGFLLGVHDRQPDVVDRILTENTTYIGTSAGAVVASQLAGGAPLEELFALQSAEDAAVGSSLDIATVAGIAQTALAGATSLEEAARRLGDSVRSGLQPDVPDRRVVLGERLLVRDWPSARLLITATDARTTRREVFDSASGVALVDAVTASCAVPLVWPAVPIGDRLFVDGGLRSGANADLARGCDPVLVLSPGAGGVDPGELSGIARSLVVRADAASAAAAGGNSLDTRGRPAVAAAAREQGRRAAEQIAGFWG
jgi:NTE family protein